MPTPGSPGYLPAPRGTRGTGGGGGPAGSAVWGDPGPGLLEAAGGAGDREGTRGGRRGPGGMRGRGRARPPPPLTRVLLAQERVLLLSGAEAALGRAARLLLGQPGEAGDAHVVHGRAGGQGPLPASPRLRRHRHRHRRRAAGRGRAHRGGPAAPPRGGSSGPGGALRGDAEAAAGPAQRRDPRDRCPPRCPVAGASPAALSAGGWRPCSGGRRRRAGAAPGCSRVKLCGGSSPSPPAQRRWWGPGRGDQPRAPSEQGRRLPRPNLRGSWSGGVLVLSPEGGKGFPRDVLRLCLVALLQPAAGGGLARRPYTHCHGGKGGVQHPVGHHQQETPWHCHRAAWWALCRRQLGLPTRTPCAWPSGDESWRPWSSPRHSRYRLVFADGADQAQPWHRRLSLLLAPAPTPGRAEAAGQRCRLAWGQVGAGTAPTGATEPAVPGANLSYGHQQLPFGKEF